MSYTNAQVAALVKALDERIARVERTLTGAPVAPAAVVAASPVAIPERGQASVKVVCAKHPDHKGGKGFSATGIIAHRTWCDGVA